jgi:large subunit ribosomal protein L18
MIKAITIKQSRLKRLARVRAKVKGDSSRPRLSVFRSNTTLSAQFIDDTKGFVILTERIDGKNILKAKELGKTIAQSGLKKGITRAVFDRSGYRYHGVVKALADAVREGGIKICTITWLSRILKKKSSR